MEIPRIWEEYKGGTKRSIESRKGEVLNGVLEEICTSTSSFEQDDVIVMIIGDNEFAGDRRI